MGAKKRRRRRGGSSRTKRRLMGVYGNVCQYCKKSFSTKILTVDHIHPLGAGGARGGSNVTLACYDCNQYKNAEYDLYLTCRGYRAKLAKSRRKKDIKLRRDLRRRKCKDCGGVRSPDLTHCYGCVLQANNPIVALADLLNYEISRVEPVKTAVALIFLEELVWWLVTIVGFCALLPVIIVGFVFFAYYEMVQADPEVVKQIKEEFDEWQTNLTNTKSSTTTSENSLEELKKKFQNIPFMISRKQ